MVLLTRVIARLELGGTQLGILRLVKPLEHRGIRTVVLAGEATPEEALRRVEAFFAHGPATRGVVRRLGYPPSRIHPGRSPIDVPEPAGRRRAGGDRRTILFAGRLHWEKGPDLLVESLALLRTPARCTLLGVGPEEAELRRRVGELVTGRPR